jgi:CheY-like chemotaxis protein
MKTRIIVIDDEPALTRMIQINLERGGKYDVATENHGSKAIEAIREFRPDIILLDIMMPDRSGDDIAQEIRDDPRLSRIPIIFLTALVTTDETDAKASRIGGNIFLAKPVKSAELIRVIEETMESAY